MSDEVEAQKGQAPGSRDVHGRAGARETSSSLSAESKRLLQFMDWDLVVACNDDALLASCLLSSPAIRTAGRVMVQRGSSSAGQAYNAGLSQAESDVVVFAHQDIYLPEGWDQCLSKAVAHLSTCSPAWAVAGVFGIGIDGRPKGHVYCTGLQRVLGRPFSGPLQVLSLDELLLVVRSSSGLRFDTGLPGFHLYGTDICLAARERNLGSYVVPAFCVHNTASPRFLPWAFWRAYFYMRRKWRDDLPIKTPCSEITFWALPVVISIARNLYAHSVKRERTGQRIPHPGALYKQLVGQGAVSIPDF